MGKWISKYHREIIKWIDIYLVIIFLPSIFGFYWVGWWNGWVILYIAFISLLILTRYYNVAKGKHTLFLLLLAILWTTQIHKSDITTRIGQGDCQINRYNKTAGGGGLLPGILSGGGQSTLRNYTPFLAGKYVSQEYVDIVNFCRYEAERLRVLKQ